MPKSNDEATLYVTLKSYLQRLQEIEDSKPEMQRRSVPTMEEIARDAGITTVAISNIATNKIKQLSLQTAGKIIIAVRLHGFPMDVADLLALRSILSESDQRIL